MVAGPRVQMRVTAGDEGAVQIEYAQMDEEGGDLVTESRPRPAALRVREIRRHGFGGCDTM